jgi:hypothetical protein
MWKDLTHMVFIMPLKPWTDGLILGLSRFGEKALPGTSAVVLSFTYSSSNMFSAVENSMGHVPYRRYASQYRFQSQYNRSRMPDMTINVNPTTAVERTLPNDIVPSQDVGVGDVIGCKMPPFFGRECPDFGFTRQ